MTHLARLVRGRLIKAAKPHFKKHPRLKQALLDAENQLAMMKHSMARVVPALIAPQPRHLDVAVTAYCNLRCIGCRYGRDFMPGSQLPWRLAHDLFEDAKEAGVEHVRLYGGEPLLHPDLSRMIEKCQTLDLKPYVTTNAMLLAEKIDDLYQAGLRELTVGFYGVGGHYDAYVQRKERFSRLEDSIATVRNRYGMDVAIQLNWLLMRPSCNLEALHKVWEFAEKYNLRIQVDLVHYSLPYFTEGPNRELQFGPADQQELDVIAKELIRLKRSSPLRLKHSELALASIPDWLIKGSKMRVPCDKYQMIWVGADGTVQLCYVTFKLGNLYDQRLSSMLFGAEHQRASCDAYALNCPNCHCGYDTRISKHVASRSYYAGRLAQIKL